jgi:hypothetical protein
MSGSISSDSQFDCVDDNALKTLLVENRPEITLARRLRLRVRAAMSLKMKVPADLSPVWQPVIERQFDLTLSPLRSRLTGVQITFHRISENGDSRYCCEVAGRLAAGDRLKISAQNSNGHIAVADVLSRVRREVSRRSRSIGAGAV